MDAEHALDPTYARKLGVNLDDLLISQPDAGEQALEIADTLVRLEQLMFWLLILWQPLCHGQNWKARWGIIMLVCMRV